jgi:hypothetical protein
MYVSGGGPRWVPKGRADQMSERVEYKCNSTMAQSDCVAEKVYGGSSIMGHTEYRAEVRMVDGSTVELTGQAAKAIDRIISAGKSVSIRIEPKRTELPNGFQWKNNDIAYGDEVYYRFYTSDSKQFYVSDLVSRFQHGYSMPSEQRD